MHFAISAQLKLKIKEAKTCLFPFFKYKAVAVYLIFQKQTDKYC